MSKHQQNAACSHGSSISCTRPSSEQVQDFLRQAEQICVERKQRLTDIRRHVLELVCTYSQPVGAYALLDDLRAEGRSAAPPTVYRALDFLQQQGLVHRLATNNTYLACAHPQTDHEGMFLVCSRCGFTQEVHTAAMMKTASDFAQDYDFRLEHAVVEITGLCHRCQD